MADQTLRRCIGSERFDIEPHEAPVDDFPKQPSQKDGLGRMCKKHWNAYTAGLARDAKARKAAAATGETMPEPEAAATPEVPTPAASGVPKPKRAKAARAEVAAETS
jgi:hypothetical protein